MKVHYRFLYLTTKKSKNILPYYHENQLMSLTQLDEKDLRVPSPICNLAPTSIVKMINRG